MNIPSFLKLSTISLGALLLVGCATPSQLYWDHKVKELCEKDGGVTVYEKVELTKEEYERNDGNNGVIRVMPEDTSLSKHDYAWRSIDTVLHESNPEVWRTEYTTYRKSDKKVLGKWITYVRRDGDIAPIDNPSSFSCSDIAGFEKNITRKIFIFNGE